MPSPNRDEMHAGAGKLLDSVDAVFDLTEFLKTVQTLLSSTGIPVDSDPPTRTFSTPAAVSVPQTTATAIMSTTEVANFVMVQADINNTDKVRVGDSNTSLTRGIQLAAGAAYTFETTNAANIFSVSASAGQKLNVVIS